MGKAGSLSATWFSPEEGTVNRTRGVDVHGPGFKSGHCRIECPLVPGSGPVHTLPLLVHTAQLWGGGGGCCEGPRGGRSGECEEPSPTLGQAVTIQGPAPALPPVPAVCVLIALKKAGWNRKLSDHAHTQAWPRPHPQSCPTLTSSPWPLCWVPPALRMLALPSPRRLPPLPYSCSHTPILPYTPTLLLDLCCASCLCESGTPLQVRENDLHIHVSTQPCHFHRLTGVKTPFPSLLCILVEVWALLPSL